MDPFNFPAIGDPRAVGSKFGSSSGTSTDIIYPVSKQVDDAFQPGRTLELAWKSDQHRFFSPKNTRLMVEYELMFGEVDTTCADIVKGPEDSTGAPPSSSVRMTCMPNSTLFDSQVRFVANNTVVEQSNFYSDLCQAQLLTTTNIEGTNTSGSGMLTSLRKDAGVPTGTMIGQQAASTMGDGYELCPVVKAPYVTQAGGARKLAYDNATLGSQLSDITSADALKLDGFKCKTVADSQDLETTIVHLVLSSTEADALKQRHALSLASFGTAYLTDVGAAKSWVRTKHADVSVNNGAVLSTATGSAPIIRADVKQNADGTYASAIATLSVDAATGGVAADTVFIITMPDASDRFNDASTALTEDVAQTLAVKVKSDVGKHTTPNPKSMCIQQGYHPGDKVSHVQVSEPIMLSSWAHPWALGPGSYQLFLTISQNWQKDLLFDPSGQYGCPTFAGAAQMFGSTKPASLKRNTVYCRIKDVSLHVHYIHPVEPYIPKSISIKTNPVTIAKRQLRSDSVQETFVVPPSTRSVLCFLTQDIHHVCADFELDGRAKAGSGVNALGITDDTTGKFKYDSRAQDAIRDGSTDPRVHNTVVPTYSPEIVAEVRSADGTAVNLEKSAPHYWTNLQVQLGQDVQPREQLAQQKPTTGEISRAWTLYTEFISKSSGFRGSVMSFADFSGYLSANYSSGARCGDRGVFHMFNLQNKSGSLSSDLQIRGQLSASPDVSAKQFLVVMAISESMFDIGYQAPSPVPVMTRIQPLS